jgi:N-ethylmaleimide reductase
MTELLYTPVTLADLELKNRVVMAPMTRSRAIGNVPNALMATYYAQRGEAGLIVTEGTTPSPDGLGYTRIPGLFNAAHVAGWRLVTDAVHAQGSRIFVQLMHTGRVGHPNNLPPGARILAPSAVAAAGTMYTDQEGPQPHPVPIEMNEADIAHAIDEFADSAALAIEAGFDGVELHAANGYLIEQFLNTATNHRSDGWGGSIEGRTRFALRSRAGSSSASARAGSACASRRMVCSAGCRPTPPPTPSISTSSAASRSSASPISTSSITAAWAPRRCRRSSPGRSAPAFLAA